MKSKFLSFLCLVFSDAVALLLCFTAAVWIRSEILPSLTEAFRLIPVRPFGNYFQYFYFAVIWIVIFANEKLYTKRFTFWDEAKVLAKSLTLSFGMIMIMIFVARLQIQFSRTVVMLAWLLSFVAFPLFRYVTKIILTRIGIWKKSLIILGVNQTASRVLKEIQKNKTLGYEIIGFLDDTPHYQDLEFGGIKVLGPTTELLKYANNTQSKDIIISLPDISRQELKHLLKQCESISESIWLIPRTGDFITSGVAIELLGNILTMNIKRNLTKPWNIWIKSIFERVFTSIAMIPMLPILGLIALAIKLDSRGPAIYSQQRLGKDRKMFNLFKFRSMYLDNDTILETYFRDNPDAQESWDKYKKLKDKDPRVTRVGRVIRRYSLDELPQLFNVLRGEMSLVGPRPYLSEELRGREEFTKTMTTVSPGITGLWQVSGRSDLPFEERVSIDEYYIRNWTLWLDITILLKSLKVLFSSHGAY